MECFPEFGLVHGLSSYYVSLKLFLYSVQGPRLMALGVIAEKLSNSRDEYNYSRDLTLC